MFGIFVHLKPPQGLEILEENSQWGHHVFFDPVGESPCELWTSWPPMSLQHPPPPAPSKPPSGAGAGAAPRLGRARLV